MTSSATNIYVGTIYQVYDHHNHAIAETRAYDTFGNVINQIGSPKTNFGFQGKYYDQESGLNYFYHRYYSSSLGRFTNEDPIFFLGGLNFYNFVRNNPIKNVDLMGLDAATGILPKIGQGLVGLLPWASGILESPILPWIAAGAAVVATGILIKKLLFPTSEITAHPTLPDNLKTETQTYPDQPRAGPPDRQDCFVLCAAVGCGTFIQRMIKLAGCIACWFGALNNGGL